MTEFDIMKELIFCMQGIEGKIIKYMSVKEGFHLNPCVSIRVFHSSPGFPWREDPFDAYVQHVSIN